MKQANKKKTSKEKRVLIASLCIAAAITAGGTFAWFTSKDEVTNRLSASASYNVSIAEDFTPPEEWVPGQTINKDVGAVNTGNIDALVRTHLEGAMNILKEQAVANEQALKYTAATESAKSSYALPDGVTISDATDENLIAMGLTKKATISGEEVYFRTLSTIERDNPALSSTTNDKTDSDANAIESTQINHYSEVEAVQAGGYLAYASGNFKFTPENLGYTYRKADDSETVTQTTPAELASTAIKDTWNTGVGLEIDSDTFVPTSSGLFIFRRNVEENADDGTYYEYSGYYADVTESGTTYYALHYLPNEDGTYNSDYVIYSTKQTAEENGNAFNVTYETSGNIKTPVVSVLPTRVKLFSASYTRLNNLKGTYAAASDGNPATVTFTNGETAADKKIEIVVALDNIGTTAETWTPLAVTDGHTYFYYNNDVEEGDSTSKIVDSVKLSDATKKSAYLAFDFDLSVLLDSVQVTVDEAGNELMPGAASATANSAKPWDPGATGTATNSGSEINLITWANS